MKVATAYATVAVVKEAAVMGVASEAKAAEVRAVVGTAVATATAGVEEEGVVLLHEAHDLCNR